MGKRYAWMATTSIKPSRGPTLSRIRLSNTSPIRGAPTYTGSKATSDAATFTIQNTTQIIKVFIKVKTRRTTFTISPINILTAHAVFSRYCTVN